jgi:drug/metabolite transporter (DMT)-like permease
MAREFSDNMRGAFFMVISMAAFTAGDACMKTVAGHMPLYQAVTLRGLLTIPALALIGYFTGGLRLASLRPSAGLLGVRTFAEIASTLTFFVALVNLPFAMLSAIMQSLPIFVTLGAMLVFGEKVGWRRMIAILVGFLGVLIIIDPRPSGVNVWALVALASVAFVVLRDLSTRRLPAQVPSVSVALLASIGVTATCAILSLQDPWQEVPAAALPLIGGAAVFVVTGYIFVIRVMRLGDVSVTTPFRYTALVWAVILGWLVFSEIPSVQTMIGAVIVVGSGLFTLMRERKLARKAG